ncbi:hypothetical protein BD413DRAFT_611897 [Trametes elegans]|nr:hypothetical protein BD413DRAFT_611897 [Trametes elegans]
MSTAVSHILACSPGIKEHPHLRQKYLDRLDEIYGSTHARGLGKDRPCIIMSDADKDLPTICVMGTFGGAKPGELGTLNNHFCIPMFPDLGVKSGTEEGDAPDGSAKEVDHIHSRPCAWPNERQWVMAHEYRSPRPMMSSWPPMSQRRRSSRADVNGAGELDMTSTTAPIYSLDRETHRWLRVVSKKRLASWLKMCEADLEFAPRCGREYDEDRLEASRKSLALPVQLGE